MNDFVTTKQKRLYTFTMRYEHATQSAPAVTDHRQSIGWNRR